MNKLDGKVAIITGGASGIGKSSAEIFLKEGASCLITDINEELLIKAKEDFKNFEGKVEIAVVDVSKKDDVEKMVEIAIAKFGKLDILMNNAGIMDNLTPIADMDDELWNKLLNVNLNSVMYGTRCAVQYFLKNNVKGNIINVSSLSGLHGGRGGLAYTTSKHAVNGLTKNVAFTYADAGIRCNAICPSNTKTNILNDMRPNELGLKKATTGVTGCAGVATSEQIASTALFLASEDSSFVNGVTLAVDLGWSAY